MIPFDQMVRQRIGLTLVEVSPRKGQASGSNETKELFVEDVEKNGPAAQAGIERGHYVTGVEGQKVPGLKAFGAALSNAKRGETINVSLQARRRHSSGFVELREGAVQLRVR
jgi:serine protease Do